jgi:hypothetical protein
MAKGSGWGSGKGKGAAKERRETRYTADMFNDVIWIT